MFAGKIFKIFVLSTIPKGLNHFWHLIFGLNIMRSIKLIIILSITLLSVYTSSAQNIININGSSKSNSKKIKTTNDFNDAKQSRELVLNEKIQSNREVRANDTILLDLFSNKQYKAYVDKIDVDVNGTLSISARIIGYDYAYCFITTFNGKSFITIDIPENSEYYLSRYSPETSTYYLLEIDKTKMKPLEGSSPLVPPAENKDDSNDKILQKDIHDSTKKNNGNTISNNPIILNGENDPEIITVMVVYTPAAAAWSIAYETNINNTISLMMTKSNLALGNSNTLLKLQLVHSQQVNYGELNNANDLYNLRNNNDGIMDNVHSLRDTYSADLVMLLEVASFTGGLGYILSTPSGSPSYGFSLTRVQQASWTYTGVHEWGHNMGCGHHRAQSTQAGPGLYSYSAGSRWTGNDNKKYCSVMTYESGSYFSDGVTHIEVPYFSNPGVLYGGVATGHPADSDNARTIRQVKSVVANYRAGMINQSISAPGWQARTFGDADFNHNISANSGLPVTLISSNTAVATIAGSKIHIVAAGSSTITASQAGDNFYNAATNLNLSLTVNKAAQTITFPALSTIAINAPDFDPGATASSGLAVTYSTSNPLVATIVGGKIRATGMGTVNITASQSGNTNYNAATNLSKSLTIAGLLQTITFSAIQNKVVGDPDFEIGAATSSGLPLSYLSSNTAVAIIVGTKIRILSAGNTTITVSQAGNATYAPATSISQSLTVNKVQQTITFGTIPNKVFGDPDFEIGATASSGLPLSYASSNTSIASIIGTKVRILAAGTVTITTQQPGNLTYDAAPNMTQSLIINKAPQIITFPEIGFRNYNDPDFTLSATSNVGLPITYKSSNINIATVTVNQVHIVSEGSVLITAMQPGNANYNAATDFSRALIVGYTLPANNFRLQSTDETCKASNNGSISITAAQSLNYTAVITGNGKNISQNFNTTMQTNSLEAGTYSICITVAGSSSYKQCFDAIIKEPKDLAVYSSIIKDGNNVLLKLEGGDSYTVELNGVTTTTTQQEISLPLIQGNNIVKISTDKICQGIIQKAFITTNSILIYPNPVKDVLNINIGNAETNSVKADIQSLDGRLIQTSNQNVEYGKIALNLAQFPRGLYILILTTKSGKTAHKFIKE